MSLLELLFPKPKQQAASVQGCSDRDHKFYMVSGQHFKKEKCQCGQHTWESYCRRWDRRP